MYYTSHHTHIPPCRLITHPRAGALSAQGERSTHVLHRGRALRASIGTAAERNRERDQRLLPVTGRSREILAGVSRRRLLAGQELRIRQTRSESTEEGREHKAIKRMGATVLACVGACDCACICSFDSILVCLYVVRARVCVIATVIVHL